MKGCYQSCSFRLKYAPNSVSAGAWPQTSLESLQRSQTPSWFRGGPPGRRSKKGKVGEGKRKGGEKGEKGREKEVG